MGNKRSIYNEENKTTEDKSTLDNTIDNLFGSFIINDDANIALCYLAIKMKNMHTKEPFRVKWCGNESKKQNYSG